MDGEVQVTEVEDARGVLRRVRKNADARWVAGLTNELDPQPLSNNLDRETLRPKKWLAVEATLLVFLAASFHFPLQATGLSYVTNEVDTWPALRELAFTSVMLRAAVWIANAGILAALSLKLAAASQLFFNFTAFGVACVSALFAVADSVLLLGACPWFGAQNECFLPLVLHWICAGFADFGPVLALLSNCVGLSSIPSVVKAANWPSFASIASLTLSLLIFAGRAGWACYAPNPPLAVQGTVEAKQVASLAVLFVAWRLNRVPQFHVAVAKDHLE